VVRPREKLILIPASSYGSDTQCAVGTSTNTAFPAAGGSVSWVCNGLYGGSSSGTCSASRSAAPVNGSCGTANGKTYPSSTTTYGSDTQCATGTSTNTAFPAVGGSVSWVCNGLYGGSNSETCSASRYSSAPVNGSCGTANGKTYLYSASNYDSDTQCTTGTSTNTDFPAVGGSVSWVCNGINGGTNSGTCSASRYASAPVNGTCGTANGHGYYATSEIDTAAEQCSAGTFASFTDNGSSWSWDCNGSNGGTNASCSANKVACGSYHNTIRRDQPSSNLCSYGTNTSLTLTSNIWYWSCTNNPGVNAACYAYKTTCGSSNGGNFSSAPTTNLCAYGTASSVTTGGTTFTWTCTGNDSLAVSCSANRTLNGSCGTANGKTYPYSTTTYGSDTQCAVGTPSSTSFPAAARQLLGLALA